MRIFNAQLMLTAMLLNMTSSVQIANAEETAKNSYSKYQRSKIERHYSKQQIDKIMADIFPTDSKPTGSLSDAAVQQLMTNILGTPTSTANKPAAIQTMSDAQIQGLMTNILGTPTSTANKPVATQTSAAVAAPRPSTPVIGNALVSWAVPRQREDGSNLAANEISGYEIYYTSENSGASEVIRINNSSQTQFNVSDLPEDSYHFSMVTIDSSGTYSNLSSVVSKTVN